MDLKKAYEILKVNQSDSFENIKTAYKKLCKKYHPDLYQDKNMKELAEEKLKEVNEAYSLIEENYHSSKSQTSEKQESDSIKIMRWNFYEWKLEKDFIKYNKLRKELEKNISFYIDFYKKLYSSYGSLDSFLSKDCKQVIQIISKTFEVLVEVCIKLNYNPPSSRVLFKSYENRILSEYYDYIDECKEFVESLEDELEDNKTRRKIKASFKQQNIATFAARHTVNLIDGVMSNQKKKSFYNNPETIEILCYLLENAMRECLDIIVELLKLKVELNPLAAISIMDNINKYDEDKQTSKLIEAIINDPYLKDPYIILLKKYGDRSLELEKIANYFGISLKNEKLSFVKLYEKELIENLNCGITNITEKINASKINEDEIIKAANIEARGTMYDFKTQVNHIGVPYSEFQRILSLHMEPFIKKTFELIASINFDKGTKYFEENISKYNLEINSKEYIETYQKKEFEKYLDDFRKTNFENIEEAKNILKQNAARIKVEVEKYCELENEINIIREKEINEHIKKFKKELTDDKEQVKSLIKELEKNLEKLKAKPDEYINIEEECIKAEKRIKLLKKIKVMTISIILLFGFWMTIGKMLVQLSQKISNKITVAQTLDKEDFSNIQYYPSGRIKIYDNGSGNEFTFKDEPINFSQLEKDIAKDNYIVDDSLKQINNLKAYKIGLEKKLAFYKQEKFTGIDFIKEEIATIDNQIESLSEDLSIIANEGTNITVEALLLNKNLTRNEERKLKQLQEKIKEYQKKVRSLWSD